MVDAPDGGVLDERMNTESGHPQDRQNTVDCAVESAANVHQARAWIDLELPSVMNMLFPG